MTSTDLSYIDIYIDSSDNRLDKSHTQYMLNYLANVYSPTMNNVKEIDDVSYVIYNYDISFNIVSNTNIYIRDNIDTTILDVRYVQYLNNWMTGRSGLNNNLSFYSGYSNFNDLDYWCRPYDKENDLTIIVTTNDNSFNYNVTEITSSTFNDISKNNIKELIIGNNVSYIRQYALYNCSNLSTVSCRNPQNSRLESIERSAFEGCINLNSIILPPLLLSIGRSSFEKCSKLETITLPDSLLSIGHKCFFDCKLLVNVYFNNIDNSQLRYIGNDVFFNCEKLQTITIPKEVVTLNYGVFHNCSQLYDIEFYDISNSKLHQINELAFSKCISLQSITIPSSVKYIGTASFYDCSNLEFIDFYDISNSNLESIYYINNDENIPLNDLGPKQFYDYTEKNTFTSSKLTKIILPPLLNTINKYVFNKCLNLSEIYFTGNLPIQLGELSGNAIIDNCFPEVFTDSSYSGIPPTIYYPGENSSWSGINTIDNCEVKITEFLPILHSIVSFDYEIYVGVNTETTPPKYTFTSVDYNLVDSIVPPILQPNKMYSFKCKKDVTLPFYISDSGWNQESRHIIFYTHGSYNSGIIGNQHFEMVIDSGELHSNSGLTRFDTVNYFCTNNEEIFGEFIISEINEGFMIPPWSGPNPSIISYSYKTFIILLNYNTQYRLSNDDYDAFKKWDDILLNLPNNYPTDKKIEISIEENNYFEENVYISNINYWHPNELDINSGILGNSYIDPYSYVKDAIILISKPVLLRSQKDQSFNKSKLYWLLLRALGHIFAFNESLALNGFIEIDGSSNLLYKGPETSAAIRELKLMYPDNLSFNTDRIPIEMDDITSFNHVNYNWVDSYNTIRYYDGKELYSLASEIMTNFTTIPIGLYISKITLGCLEDLHYDICYNKADPFPISSNPLNIANDLVFNTKFDKPNIPIAKTKAEENYYFNHFDVLITNFHDPTNSNLITFDDISGAFHKWNNIITKLPPYFEENEKFKIVVVISRMNNIREFYSRVKPYEPSNANGRHGYKKATIVLNGLRIPEMKQLESNGKSKLYYIMLKDIAHAFGVGIPTVWERNELIFNISTKNKENYWYTGNRGVEEYQKYYAEQTLLYIPIIKNRSDWHEPIYYHFSNNIELLKNTELFTNTYSNATSKVDLLVLNRKNFIHTGKYPGLYNELMAKKNRKVNVELFFKFGPPALSRVTLGCMEDLGYEISYYDESQNERYDYYDPFLINTFAEIRLIIRRGTPKIREIQMKTYSNTEIQKITLNFDTSFIHVPQEISFNQYASRWSFVDTSNSVTMTMNESGSKANPIQTKFDSSYYSNEWTTIYVLPNDISINLLNVTNVFSYPQNFNITNFVLINTPYIVPNLPRDFTYLQETVIPKWSGNNYLYINDVYQNNIKAGYMPDKQLTGNPIISKELISYSTYATFMGLMLVGSPDVAMSNMNITTSPATIGMITAEEMNNMPPITMAGRRLVGEERESRFRRRFNTRPDQDPEIDLTFMGGVTDNIVSSHDDTELFPNIMELLDEFTNDDAYSIRGILIVIGKFFRSAASGGVGHISLWLDESYFLEQIRGVVYAGPFVEDWKLNWASSVSTILNDRIAWSWLYKTFGSGALVTDEIITSDTINKDVDVMPEPQWFLDLKAIPSININNIRQQIKLLRLTYYLTRFLYIRSKIKYKIEQTREDIRANEVRLQEANNRYRTNEETARAVFPGEPWPSDRYREKREQEQAEIERLTRVDISLKEALEEDQKLKPHITQIIVTLKNMIIELFGNMMTTERLSDQLLAILKSSFGSILRNFGNQYIAKPIFHLIWRKFFITNRNRMDMIPPHLLPYRVELRRLNEIPLPGRRLMQDDSMSSSDLRAVLQETINEGFQIERYFYSTNPLSAQQSQDYMTVKTMIDTLNADLKQLKWLQRVIPKTRMEINMLRSRYQREVREIDEANYIMENFDIIDVVTEAVHGQLGKLEDQIQDRNNDLSSYQTELDNTINQLMAQLPNIKEKIDVINNGILLAQQVNQVIAQPTNLLLRVLGRAGQAGNNIARLFGQNRYHRRQDHGDELRRLDELPQESYKNFGGSINNINTIMNDYPSIGNIKLGQTAITEADNFIDIMSDLFDKYSIPAPFLFHSPSQESIVLRAGQRGRTIYWKNVFTNFGERQRSLKLWLNRLLQYKLNLSTIITKLDIVNISSQSNISLSLKSLPISVRSIIAYNSAVTSVANCNLIIESLRIRLSKAAANMYARRSVIYKIAQETKSANPIDGSYNVNSVLTVLDKYREYWQKTTTYGIDYSRAPPDFDINDDTTATYPKFGPIFWEGIPNNNNIILTSELDVMPGYSKSWVNFLYKYKNDLESLFLKAEDIGIYTSQIGRPLFDSQSQKKWMPRIRSEIETNPDINQEPVGRWPPWRKNWPSKLNDDKFLYETRKDGKLKVSPGIAARNIKQIHPPYVNLEGFISPYMKRCIITQISNSLNTSINAAKAKINTNPIKNGLWHGTMISGLNASNYDITSKDEIEGVFIRNNLYPSKYIKDWAFTTSEEKKGAQLLLGVSSLTMEEVQIMTSNGFDNISNYTFEHIGGIMDTLASIMFGILNYSDISLVVSENASNSEIELTELQARSIIELINRYHIGTPQDISAGSANYENFNLMTLRNTTNLFNEIKNTISELNNAVSNIQPKFNMLANLYENYYLISRPSYEQITDELNNLILLDMSYIQQHIKHGVNIIKNPMNHMGYFEYNKIKTRIYFDDPSYIPLYLPYGTLSITSELINNKLIEHSNLEPHHSLKDLSKNNIYYVNIGIQIVEIGLRAFFSCTALKNVVFSDLSNSQLTSINVEAFMSCTSLDNIVFPRLISNIQYDAFALCESLTNVFFYNRYSPIEIIRQSTFYKCFNLKDIKIPANIHTIDSSAFYDCSNLEVITFDFSNNNLTTIKDSAFYNCQSLTEIVFPSNIDSIGTKAFHTCDKLKSIHFTGNFPDTFGKFPEPNGKDLNMSLDVFAMDPGDDSRENNPKIYYPNGNSTWNYDQSNTIGTIDSIPLLPDSQDEYDQIIYIKVDISASSPNIIYKYKFSINGTNFLDRPPTLHVNKLYHFVMDHSSKRHPFFISDLSWNNKSANLIIFGDGDYETGIIGDQSFNLIIPSSFTNSYTIHYYCTNIRYKTSMSGTFNVTGKTVPLRVIPFNGPPPFRPRFKYKTFTIHLLNDYILSTEDLLAFKKWDDIIISLPSHYAQNAKIQIYYGNTRTANSHTIYRNRIEKANIYIQDIYKKTINNYGVSLKYFMLLRELGHVFAFANLLLPLTEQGENNRLKYWYTGPASGTSHAISEYQNYFNDVSLTRIPMEQAPHHNEFNLDNGKSDESRRSFDGKDYFYLKGEIMTDFNSFNSKQTFKISKITIGVLDDLGYTVNYNKADLYDPNYSYSHINSDSHNISPTYSKTYNAFTLDIWSGDSSYGYNDVSNAFDKWDKIITHTPGPLDRVMHINLSFTRLYGSYYCKAGCQINEFDPNSTDSNNFYPDNGWINLNIDKMEEMKNKQHIGGSELYHILLHEIGHAFGLGNIQLLRSKHLTTFNTTINEYGKDISDNIGLWYTGQKGVDAYREYFIDLSLSYIPLTIPNNPRSGLIDGVGVHHEANDNNYNLFNGFNYHNNSTYNTRNINGKDYPGVHNEIMGGWIDSSSITGTTPLSRITLGCLEDLGYDICYNYAGTNTYDYYNPNVIRTNADIKMVISKQEKFQRVIKIKCHADTKISKITLHFDTSFTHIPQDGITNYDNWTFSDTSNSVTMTMKSIDENSMYPIENYPLSIFEADTPTYSTIYVLPNFVGTADTSINLLSVSNVIAYPENYDMTSSITLCDTDIISELPIDLVYLYNSHFNELSNNDIPRHIIPWSGSGRRLASNNDSDFRTDLLYKSSGSDGKFGFGTLMGIADMLGVAATIVAVSATGGAAAPVAIPAYAAKTGSVRAALWIAPKMTSIVTNTVKLGESINALNAAFITYFGIIPAQKAFLYLKNTNSQFASISISEIMRKLSEFFHDEKGLIRGWDLATNTWDNLVATIGNLLNQIHATGSIMTYFKSVFNNVSSLKRLGLTWKNRAMDQLKDISKFLDEHNIPELIKSNGLDTLSPSVIFEFNNMVKLLQTAIISTERTIIELQMKWTVTTSYIREYIGRITTYLNSPKQTIDQVLKLKDIFIETIKRIEVYGVESSENLFFGPSRSILEPIFSRFNFSSYIDDITSGLNDATKHKIYLIMSGFTQQARFGTLDKPIALLRKVGNELKVFISASKNRIMNTFESSEPKTLYPPSPPPSPPFFIETKKQILGLNNLPLRNPELPADHPTNQIPDFVENAIRSRTGFLGGFHNTAKLDIQRITNKLSATALTPIYPNSKEWEQFVKQLYGFTGNLFNGVLHDTNNIISQPLHLWIENMSTTLPHVSRAIKEGFKTVSKLSLAAAEKLLDKSKVMHSELYRLFKHYKTSQGAISNFHINQLDDWFSIPSNTVISRPRDTALYMDSIAVTNLIEFFKNLETMWQDAVKGVPKIFKVLGKVPERDNFNPFLRESIHNEWRVSEWVSMQGNLEGAAVSHWQMIGGAEQINHANLISNHPLSRGRSTNLQREVLMHRPIESSTEVSFSASAPSHTLAERKAWVEAHGRGMLPSEESQEALEWSQAKTRFMSGSPRPDFQLDYMRIERAAENTQRLKVLPFTPRRLEEQIFDSKSTLSADNWLSASHYHNKKYINQLSQYVTHKNLYPDEFLAIDYNNDSEYKTKLSIVEGNPRLLEDFPEYLPPPNSKPSIVSFNNIDSSSQLIDSIFTGMGGHECLGLLGNDAICTMNGWYGRFMQSGYTREDVNISNKNWFEESIGISPKNIEITNNFETFNRRLGEDIKYQQLEELSYNLLKYNYSHTTQIMHLLSSFMKYLLDPSATAFTGKTLANEEYKLSDVSNTFITPEQSVKILRYIKQEPNYKPLYEETMCLTLRHTSDLYNKAQTAFEYLYELTSTLQPIYVSFMNFLKNHYMFDKSIYEDPNNPSNVIYKMLYKLEYDFRIIESIINQSSTIIYDPIQVLFTDINWTNIYVDVSYNSSTKNYSYVFYNDITKLVPAQQGPSSSGITTLKTKHFYNFFPLIDASAHPFYVSNHNTNYRNDSHTSSRYSIRGDGTFNNGIVYPQSFTLFIINPLPDENLYYYDTNPVSTIVTKKFHMQRSPPPGPPPAIDSTGNLNRP
uniref:Uncharacterized protein n=1 Tax=viral metagenome TaxID=1070528 RepID=A0A6C0B019_9ZZZZ|tara:strand:+ start:4410 stop:19988 length:15579 start_codon:yes stop_codon:yes gene_type:complete